MNESPSAAELLSLISRLCDNGNSPAETQRLEALLQADRAARQLYYDWLLLHGELTWTHAHTTAGATKFPAEIPVAVQAHQPQPVAAASLPVFSTAAGSLFGRFSDLVHRPALWSILGVATIFYGVFALLSWDIRLGTLNSGAEQAQSPPAALEPIAAAKDRDSTDTGTQPAPGATDQPYGVPQELASGFVRKTLPQGVTLLIEGPARWTVDGKNQATLESGKLIATVPPLATGFTLHTPTATVTDLGTEFGVQVDPQGNSNVEVFQGRIELRSPHAQPVLLGEKQAAHVDGKRLALVPANDRPYSALRKQFGREIELVQDELVDWNQSQLWSDQRAPAPVNHYHVGRTAAKRLRTPIDLPIAPFAGGALTIHPSGELAPKCNGLAMVRDLRLAGGSIYVDEAFRAHTAMALGGRLTVEEPSSINLHGCTLTFALSMSGSGSLHVVGAGKLCLRTDGQNFQGDWLITGAHVLATTFSSLGSGNLTVQQDGVLEPVYKVTNATATLQLKQGGKLILRHDMLLGAVVVDGAPLADGRYTIDELKDRFPASFDGSEATLTVGKPSADDAHTP